MNPMPDLEMIYRHVSETHFTGNQLVVKSRFNSNDFPHDRCFSFSGRAG